MFLMGVYQKLNRSIPSSAVGVGLCLPEYTKQTVFGRDEPRPYELNDSIIHVLTIPILFMGRYLINKYDKK